MSEAPPAILPLGEAAFTIRLGDAASVAVAERAAMLAERIRRAGIDGVTDVVAAVASVAVYYGAGGKGQAARENELRAAIAGGAETAATALDYTTHVVPVRYDGPDLDDVASRTGFSRDDVIARHTTREYRVLALGFLPGWAYLGMIDPALALPRRAAPRTRVPAGSVAIMGEQTGIYPRVSPGGWHLIGSTDVVLFDATRARPALLRSGDRVRFIRVAEDGAT